MTKRTQPKTTDDHAPQLARDEPRRELPERALGLERSAREQDDPAADQLESARAVAEHERIGKRSRRERGL